MCAYRPAHSRKTKCAECMCAPVGACLVFYREEIGQVYLMITESLQMLVPELKTTQRLLPKCARKTVRRDRYAGCLCVCVCVDIRRKFSQRWREAVKLGIVRHRVAFHFLLYLKNKKQSLCLLVAPGWIVYRRLLLRCDEIFEVFGWRHLRAPQERGGLGRRKRDLLTSGQSRKRIGPWV